MSVTATGVWARSRPANPAGPELEQALARPGRRRLAQVHVRELAGRIQADRAGAVGLVDGHVGQVGEQLGASVGRGPGREQLRVRLDEAGGQAPGPEVGVVQDGLQERDVGGHAADAELGQGAAGAVDRGLECPAAAGELGQQRVEVRRHLGPGVGGAAVEADACATRRPVRGDHAGVGPEPVGRVLGRDPALQRGPSDTDAVLVQAQIGQRLPRRDAQLGLHQVDVGDLLGHRVLNLDARVHLDEDVAPRRVEQELDRARVDVADLPGEPHRVGAHPRAQLRVQMRCGRDLDDLLVAALHRAVALVQVDHVAGRVGEHLHLDVAGVSDGLLDEDGRVTERGLRLAHARLDRRAQRPRLLDTAHAAAAAPRHRLHEDGEGKGQRLLDERVNIGARRDAAQRGHAGRPGGGDRSRLVAGQGEHARVRADERDARVSARLGQGRVLRQEAVAGVDGIGARLDGGLDDQPGVEVGPHRMPGLADLVRLVGLEPVLGIAVLVGEHRHRLGAELVGGAEGADRDLAAVGHQNLREHDRESPIGRGPATTAANGKKRISCRNLLF